MAFRKIIPYIIKNKERLFFGFAFVSISNFLAVLIPRFVGNAIDSISTKNFQMDFVITQIFWILLLTICSGLLMYLTRKTIIVLSREIEYELRKDFISKLSCLPYSFFVDYSTGKLMSLATNDISSAREFLGPAIMYTVNTITTFFLALLFMLSLDVKLTLLSIIPLPLITATTYFIGKRIHRNFKDVQEQFSKLSTQSQETFSGIRLVRSFVREAFEAKQFNKLSEDYRQKFVRLEFYQSLMIPLLIVLIGFSQLIVIGYGGLRVIEKTMTIGVVSQFFVYINLLIWPVAAIGWVTNLIQRANASIERLWEIFDIKIEKGGIAPVIPQTLDAPASIFFDDIWFKYKDGLPWILKGISFKILPYSSVGIIGGVGSGKSTIFRLIIKIYAPTRGNIFIGGISLEKLKQEFIRNFVAIVPQEPFLFSDSIAENVRLGNPNATDQEIEFVLKLAGFETDLRALPDGINTMVGERGINLSGGQKQRIAIARAMIARPKILLLDDAFSSVDSETEQLILLNIFTHFSNTTKIIISNKISSVMHCDKILVLDNGMIAEEGNHQSLLDLSGKYRRLFDIQKLSEELEKEN